MVCDAYPLVGRVGDMDARLQFVYLTATERMNLTQEQINPWYHVFIVH
jgi:hypothetical protein